MELLVIFSNPRMLRRMTGLVSAARKRGHSVSVFFNEESVKLLLDHEALREVDARMLACVSACENVGIKQSDMPKKGRVTSLGEIVMLMEKSDRTLVLE